MENFELSNRDSEKTARLPYDLNEVSNFAEMNGLDIREAAGFIILANIKKKTKKELCVLLVQNRGGRVVLPQGGVENDELTKILADPVKGTAKRETYEETGIGIIEEDKNIKEVEDFEETVRRISRSEPRTYENDPLRTEDEKMKRERCGAVLVKKITFFLALHSKPPRTLEPIDENVKKAFWYPVKNLVMTLKDPVMGYKEEQELVIKAASHIQNTKVAPSHKNYAAYAPRPNRRDYLV